MKQKATRHTKQVTVKRGDKAEQGGEVKRNEKSSPSIQHKNQHLFQPHLSYDILYTKRQRSSGVEQRFRKPPVVGSIPTAGSNYGGISEQTFRKTGTAI